MRSARLVRLAVATLAAASLASFGTAARADAAAGAAAAPACQAYVAGTRGNTGPSAIQVPANAPALLLQELYGYEPKWITASAELVIDTEKTTPIAPAARDANGLPILPLWTKDPGKYRVRITPDCGSQYGSYKVPSEAQIEIVAASPLPTRLGTIREAPSATTTPTPGMATFVLEPSAEARPFMPVIRVEATLNGAKGQTLSGPSLTSDIQITLNTGSVCVENGALLRDKKSVRIDLDGAIAGIAEKLAPATLETTVDCGAIKWTKESDFGDDDGTTTTPSTGAPAGSTTSAGGCSAAPGHHASTALGAAGFAAALALVVSRRRRRTA
ncbi:MAG: hypothetical protein JST00_31900 [Deltaproteobacteria bacterium]|nr:hypothetical protein [Deltaproteobacteria bacterium]